jgi:hypothetical protein
VPGVIAGQLGGCPSDIDAIVSGAIYAVPFQQGVDGLLRDADPVSTSVADEVSADYVVPPVRPEAAQKDAVPAGVAEPIARDQVVVAALQANPG